MNKAIFLYFSLCFLNVSAQDKLFKNNNYSIKISAISQKEFYAKPVTPKPKLEYEEILLKKDADFVRRKNGVLTIKTQPMILAFSDSTPSSIDSKRYSYLGRLNNTNYVIVEETGDEWGNTILINKLTGDTVNTNYYLELSDDHKNLLTYYGTGMGGGESSKMQIFSHENNILKSLWKLSLEDGIVNDCKWEGSNTILVKFEHLNNQYTYSKISFTKVK